MIGIYKITSPSNKIYIGQSRNIEDRIGHYKRLDCRSQIRIFNSLKKHGADKHKFEILCQCEINQLNELEKYYVDLFQTYNSEYGLNLRDGGGQRVKLSEEVKEKLSIGKMGAKNPMYGTKGYWFGKKRIFTWKYSHTEESKKKIGFACKGRKHPKCRYISVICKNNQELFYGIRKEVADWLVYNKICSKTIFRDLLKSGERLSKKGNHAYPVSKNIDNYLGIKFIYLQKDEQNAPPISAVSH